MRDQRTKQRAGFLLTCLTYMIGLTLAFSWTVGPGLAHTDSKASFKESQHHSPEEMNEKFKAADLEVEKFISRFEAPDREVFTAREAIVDALAIKPGEYIADVGAGTGIFEELFSKAVGSGGWVYAVDISAGFLNHINGIAGEKGLKNLSCVLSRDQSICLPKDCVDTVFICNTYHHFGESSKGELLKSIDEAIRDGGRLVLIDFDRVEGKSREWIMKHIHKSSKAVIKEIEAAGFKLQEEKKVGALKENYFLIFTKGKEEKENKESDDRADSAPTGGNDEQ